jgi:GAF domain-containing protein
MPDDPAVLTDAFRRIARELFVIGSTEATLHRIVSLAVEVIPGADYAGVTRMHERTVTTPAWSDELVLGIDEAQYALDQGPCLSAIRLHGTFEADDLGADARWPAFGPRAAEMGIASLLSFRLHTSPEDDELEQDATARPSEPDASTLGALNLYARDRDAFGDADHRTGAVFAAYASVALEAAEAYTGARAQAEGLQLALGSRDLIGQAKGILMAREHVTADEAFDILRTTSQHLNIKVRELAAHVAETGELPDDGR